MSDVNLSISQEVVRPIIEAKIQAAITAELAGAAPMMERIVARVLMAKVDTEGKESCYAKEGQTFVKWLCEDCIRKAAIAAVQESVEKMKPQLQALIVKDLEKRKAEIAGSLVGFFADATKLSYHIRANVTVSPRE